MITICLFQSFKTFQTLCIKQKSTFYTPFTLKQLHSYPVYQINIVSQVIKMLVVIFSLVNRCSTLPNDSVNLDKNRNGFLWMLKQVFLVKNVQEIVAPYFQPLNSFVDGSFVHFIYRLMMLPLILSIVNLFFR